MRLATILTLLLLAGCRTGAPASSNDPLASEPYRVGFTSRWLIDPTRTYDTALPDGRRYANAFPGGRAPRPILVNTWYPADTGGTPMRHGDYLEVSAPDPRLTAFHEAIADYERRVICEQLVGAPPDELDPAGRAALEAHLATPILAARDAPAAPGRFPVVIYHAGAGSSYEDNARLCEYLAAHGYVVIGSTFLAADGASFNVDARDASAEDVAFLLAHARTLPFADATRAAMIGHSAGAHATLWTATGPDIGLDALICLDTTQDYYSPANPLWRPMVERTLARSDRITAPLLMAAEPHAIFDLADRLESAPRTYLTVPFVDHDSFISQGVARARHERDAEAEAIAAAYTGLCRYVLCFLDAHVKQDAAALAELRERHVGAQPGRALRAEHVAPGGVAIEPFIDDGSSLPAPRQVRPFLANHGVEATAALLERVAERDPDSPLFHPIFGMSLFLDLHAAGSTEEMERLWPAYRNGRPELVDSYVSMARLLFQIGEGHADRTAYARTCLEIAAVLDPAHVEANELRR